MDFDCDRIQDLKDLDKKKRQEGEDRKMAYLKEFGRSLSLLTWLMTREGKEECE